MLRFKSNAFTGVLIFAAAISIVIMTGGPTGADQTLPVDLREATISNSIDSHLAAVAINGRSITPTTHPYVAVGDVVTFRVQIQNTYPGVMKGIVCGVEWGAGFAYPGNLTGNLLHARYDDHARNIVVNIDEIQSLVEKGTSDSTNVYYTFDLQVVGCEQLFLEVHTDELYACRPVSLYHATVRISTPEIHYTVHVSVKELLARRKQTAAILMNNIGDGPAAAVFIQTNLAYLPVRITEVSPGFIYEAETGAFIAENIIEPGEAVALHFDMVMTSFGDPPEPSIRFIPQYADVCGLLFIPSPISVELSSSTATPLRIIENGPDPVLRVSPECCRVAPGTPLSWTIHVTNRGDAMAMDVVLEDVLGDDLIFHRAGTEPARLPEIREHVPSHNQTTLTWRLGDIGPSRTKQVTVTAMSRGKMDYPWMMMDGSRVRLTFARDEDTSRTVEKTAPCFIFPKDCIHGDVFGEDRRLHGFLGITQMYKSNLFRTADNPEDVWATFLTPGVWAAVPASRDRIVEIVTTSATPGGLSVGSFFPSGVRRYQAYMLYSPQFEYYHDHSNQNFVSHRMDGYFQYHSRNKVSLRVFDQFKRSHDSISSRRFTGKDKYITNLFSTVGTIDPSPRLRFRLDYSNFFLDYDADANARNNRVDNSWSLYGFFHLTSKTSLFAEYEYGRMHYSRNDLDSREYRYFGGVRWDVTQKTKGQIKGGHGRKVYDSIMLSDVDNWVAEIQLDHQLTIKTNMVVKAFRRYEEAMGTHITGDESPRNRPINILTHLAAVSLSHDITGKIKLHAHATYFYDVYGYEESLLMIDKRKDKEIAVSPAIKFNFQRWLTFDLAYVYTNRESTYSRYNHTDHTVFLRASIYN